VDSSAGAGTSGPRRAAIPEVAMTRSTNFTIAAILAGLLSLANFVTALILLPQGAAELAAQGDQPPYAVIVIKLIVGAVGLVAAYGAFRVQRWGIILTLILMVLNILGSLPGVAFAPSTVSRISSIVTVVVAGSVLWLLLRRDARALASADATS
jgi:hypothetical protein